jgi:hypothetical protein
MSNSSPEGITLGKGSKLESLKVSIDKEVTLDIKKKVSLTYTFEISEEAFAFLKLISDGRFMEYRDILYYTVEDFLGSEEFKGGFRTLESFKERNEDGTYHLCHELSEHDFVEFVEETWYITYRITDLGRKVLKLNI